MYMYFAVGVWLLGLLAIILATIVEWNEEKNSKLKYALAIPGTISISSFWSFCITKSLEYLKINSNDAGGYLALSILGIIAVGALYCALNSSQMKYTESKKFYITVGLVYIISIIVMVCFIYPTIMINFM